MLCMGWVGCFEHVLVAGVAHFPPLTFFVTIGLASICASAGGGRCVLFCFLTFSVVACAGVQVTIGLASIMWICGWREMGHG